MEDRNDGQDTDVVSISQLILDELRNVREELKDLKKKQSEQSDAVNERLDNIENRVEQLVTDVNTVHEFQRTYTARLSAMEKMCVDIPLKSTASSSTPTPSSAISIAAVGKGK